MAKAHLYNGMTDILQGQIDIGKKEVAEAVRLDPGNVRARLVLGDLYLRANAPAAAEKEAIEVLKRNPANVQAAVIYGASFLLRKDWKKAEQVYTSMIKQMPKNSVGYLKMGQSRKMQQKPTEAAKYFAQAMEQNPKDLTAVNAYVFALAAAKDVGKAKSVLDEYIGKEPKNPLIWEMAGRFHAAGRNPAEAEKGLLKAIELAPDFTRPYYELGVIYVAQKKLAEADEKFRKG